MTTLDILGKQKAVLLETRKRDGTWVGTPVSIIVVDGRAYFRSYDASGKAKRLRNFPAVKVAPSTMRGKPTGPSVPGIARLLDEAEAAPVRAALKAKYPLRVQAPGAVAWEYYTPANRAESRPVEITVEEKK